MEIVGAMLGDPIGWHHGLAVSAAAGLAAGTAYPTLARLERAGWLESRWEERAAGAPRRRLYRLTGLGQRLAPAPTPGPRSRPAGRLRLGLPLPKARFG